jgi:cyclopropane-fatty-acyl-phospholipid synthase
MADKKDIDFIYTTLDKIFRLSIGENADYSGAMYNGDFSLTLEEAQRAKHEFISEQLKIEKGSRVLEMGSGWGPFLKFATEVKEAEVIGLTLSDGQYNSCLKHGFEVYVKDCREINADDFGKFNAVVSIGAFEHFCSLEDYKKGRQDEVYTNFFKTVADVLQERGRFFLQTMTFTEKMVQPVELNIDADKNSAAYLLALTAQHHPGSWLPYGHEMILRNAAPFFKMVNISSGRADYIETIRQWRKRLRSFNLKKYGLYFDFLRNLILRRDFRHLINVFRISPIMRCFERDLMNHYRIVFEKV